MSNALFELDGSRAQATELSRGPWNPQHCHGGPVSALLARAAVNVEGADAATSWNVARLTIELSRPVPVLAPMSISAQVERAGRKVSTVSAVLTDGEVEVARVRALRIRATELSLPDGANLAVDQPLADVAQSRLGNMVWADPELVAFHSHGCEHRYVEGSWDIPGPVAVWIKLLHPVIEGETPSGLERVAAAADFGNGVSGSLPHDRFLFINPDLSIHLFRQLSGPWVGMRTSSYYGPAGVGMAESQLFDDTGRLGRSCQSLFVDPR